VWQRARGPLAGALALAACLAVLAVLSGGEDEAAEPHTERGGPPAAFLGLVAEDAFGKPGRYRRDNLDRLRAAGVGLIRQTFDWARIERSPGRYEFAYYDRYVAALSERRVRLLPILFNPPGFRSSAPHRGARRGTYPPRSPADMGAFGAALARRYGPAGSFWREHPELPRLPVDSWQVWNEPNLPVYWPSGPDAAQYVALLKGTGRGIRSVDPGAEILTAGLPDSRLGVPLREYVAGMYAAGGAGAFDALAVNPYGLDAHGVLDTVRTVRRVAETSGDNPAVWVTELGWATGGPRSAFLVSEAEQARLLEQTLLALARRRNDLRIRGVVYFNWRDSSPYAGGRDFFGLHTGLLHLNGHAKPAYAAYKKVAKTLGLLPD
jgi:polysaccharide biosynthesis protein PslG